MYIVHHNPANLAARSINTYVDTMTDGLYPCSLMIHYLTAKNVIIWHNTMHRTTEETPEEDLVGWCQKGY